ncbi:Na/Pi cotransporter family protein [Agrobacterium rhizogenes]|nr:Na/Pi cotransporter family protein [Rhizobium rhizogenes]
MWKWLQDKRPGTRERRAFRGNSANVYADCVPRLARTEKFFPGAGSAEAGHLRLYLDPLMVASFVERELVKPPMAQIVLLGAYVGTAVTACKATIGAEWLSPLVLLSGIVLYRSKPIGKKSGEAAMIGMDAMLLSMHFLSGDTEPLRQSALAVIIGTLDNAWPMALTFSAAIAFTPSSTLAAVVLTLSLTVTGILSAYLIAILVPGANLGGAIPPVVGSPLGPASAKRVMSDNLIIRAIGCLIALPLVGYGADLPEMLPLPSTELPVNALCSFSLILAGIAGLLSPMLSSLMLRHVHEEAIPGNAAKYLDQYELSTPVAALVSVTRDIDLAKQMMDVKVELRWTEKQSSERHLERLRNGGVDSLQPSSLHLNMLPDLNRITAHIASIAHPIMDKSGLLFEDRLRHASR